MRRGVYAAALHSCAFTKPSRRSIFWSQLPSCIVSSLTLLCRVRVSRLDSSTCRTMTPAPLCQPWTPQLVAHIMQHQRPASLEYPQAYQGSPEAAQVALSNSTLLS